jgi:hypothetical protein
VGTPGALHDDYVDALVQALTYLRGNVGACSFSRAWSCARRDELISRRKIDTFLHTTFSQSRTMNQSKPEEQATPDALPSSKRWRSRRKDKFRSPSLRRRPSRARLRKRAM